MTAFPSPPDPAGWRRERRDLYHGIPVRLIARGCPEAAWAAVWRLLEDADAACNRFAPGSEVSRLAARPDGDGARLSPLLATAVRGALAARRLSRGASDASVRPLVALWREAVAAGTWPEPTAIAAGRAACRLGDAAVDGDGILRIAGPPWRADLDLGGVVKGILVDLAAGRLRAAGVVDLLVQVGGETAVAGRAPGGGPWRIGLQHPLAEGQVWLVLTAPVAGLSCSTSADYRRGWEIAGRPVSHLVDPRSGLPASPDLLTAHVAIPGCGRCGDAEALTKAVALLGRDEADAAVADAGGEWLHLEAADDGLVETRSHGFAALAAAA